MRYGEREEKKPCRVYISARRHLDCRPTKGISSPARWTTQWQEVRPCRKVCVSSCSNTFPSEGGDKRDATVCSTGISFSLKTRMLHERSRKPPFPRKATSGRGMLRTSSFQTKGGSSSERRALPNVNIDTMNLHLCKTGRLINRDENHYFAKAAPEGP